MNITASTILDISPHSKNDSISCFAFHPVESVIAVCFGSIVNVYEIDGGYLIGSINCRKRITHITLSVESIIVADESAFIQVWDYTNFTMIGILDISQSEKPLSSIITSQTSPYTCFSRAGGKTIFVNDISKKGITKPVLKIDCKKPVTSISFHPTESTIAAYCDGVVKIVDCTNGTIVAQSDELSKLCTLNNKPTSKGFVAFDNTGYNLVAATEKGQTILFTYEDKQLTNESYNLSDDPSLIIGLCFHPYYPAFLTLSSEGIFVARDLKCSSYGAIKLAAVSELESIERRYKLPRYARSTDDKFCASQMIFHQKYNYLSFLSTCANLNHRQIVYSIADYESTLPIHSFMEVKQSNQSTHIIRPTVKFPNHLYYLHHYDGNIYEYNFHTSIQSSKFNLDNFLQSQPIDPANPQGEFTKYFPIKYSFSQTDSKHLLLMRKYTSSSNLYTPRTYDNYYLILPAENPTPKLAKDVLFINDETSDIVALLPDRKTIELVGVGVFNINERVDALFQSSPLFKRSIIYQQNRYLVMSSNCFDETSGLEWYQMNDKHKLQLRPTERVTQIKWNLSKNKSTYYGAILTTLRILIVNSRLEIISSTFAKRNSLNSSFFSIYWVDNCLFFNSNSHVHYLTLAGNVHTLCEINHPNSVITAILSDRLIYVSYEGGDLKVSVKAIGLLEPMVLAELENPYSHVDNKKNNNDENNSNNNIIDHRCDEEADNGLLHHNQVEEISYFVAKFDSKRISTYLISSFEKYKYYNYALELAKYLPFISIQQKFTLALLSLDFQFAYSLITEPHLYDREYALPVPKLTHHSTSITNLKETAASSDNLLENINIEKSDSAVDNNNSSSSSSSIAPTSTTTQITTLTSTATPELSNNTTSAPSVDQNIIETTLDTNTPQTPSSQISFATDNSNNNSTSTLPMNNNNNNNSPNTSGENLKGGIDLASLFNNSNNGGSSNNNMNDDRIAKSTSFSNLANSKVEATIQISHPFYGLFKELANISVKFGQFKIALKCYEKIEDYYSIVRLYAIHGHTTALQNLLKFFQSQSIVQGLYNLPTLISGNQPSQNRFTELMNSTKRLLKSKSLSLQSKENPIMNLEFSKVIPCVDSTPVSLLSFITPREILNIYQYQFTICLGFLDKLEKWLPIASNELADLFFSSLNQQNDPSSSSSKRSIPATPNHIIPLFISWFREFQKKVAEVNNALKRPSNKLEPAHLGQLLVRRDGYLVSFSSTLKKYKIAKNQTAQLKANSKDSNVNNNNNTSSPLSSSSSSSSPFKNHSSTHESKKEIADDSDLSDYSNDSSINDNTKSEENESDSDFDKKTKESKIVNIVHKMRSESGNHILLKNFEVSIPPPLNPLPPSQLSTITSPTSLPPVPTPKKSKFLSPSVSTPKAEVGQSKPILLKDRRTSRSTHTSSSALFESISSSVNAMRKSTLASPVFTSKLQITADDTQFALAKRRKENAIVLLENGFLSNALAELEEAISILSKYTEHPKQKEMKICVKYKLALKLLILCKSLDFSNDKFQIAKLCCIIATIALDPAHRLALCAVAAEKNYLCENYGLCAQFFKITTRFQSESCMSQVQSILQQCEEKKYSNRMDFFDNKRPFFCYQTFCDITGKSYYSCNFCDSKFAITSKMADEVCNYCCFGKLEKKKVSTSPLQMNK